MAGRSRSAADAATEVDVTPLELLVDAVAAYRLTKLVTDDEITEQPRAGVVRRSFEANGLEYDGDVDETALDVVQRYRAEHGLPPKLATLLTCRWCAGVWIGAGVVAARRAAPRAWQPLAEALSLAAAAALIAGLED